MLLLVSSRLALAVRVLARAMSALDNGTRPAFVAPTAEKAAKVVVLVVVSVRSSHGMIARFWTLKFTGVDAVMA